MSWRPTASLTPGEARELHYSALVIDTKYPGALSVATERIRSFFDQERQHPGAFRQQVYARTKSLIVRELWENADAREAYWNLWDRTGVDAGVVGVMVTQPPGEGAFLDCVRGMASEVFAPVLSSEGRIRVATSAAEIEAVHATGKHAVIVAWENSSPIGHDLSKLDLFYNLGVRSVQLTYNLRNLIGDGCTERTNAGLSRFGVEFVQQLNAKRMIVDASHASEATALDAIAVSTSPVAVSHTTAKSVYWHDRGSSDDVIKAAAHGGGYIGVLVVPGFFQDNDEATLDQWAAHVEHIARVAGIDAVGIGTDLGDIYTIPADEARFETHYPPGFPWHGFTAEHRSIITKMIGYQTVLDWPNLTVALAKRGFNEDELRKILGLNYLRFFRDVVG